ncbi:copper resistance CopC family protein [Actinoallomurus rhizosphaericola]|uniref:copper resistance CopC family protein n=1 Tax=Actinoallomurus rhizosphaericola TaxID=2952536 RepID=UPI002091F71F|nr:copper resistance CopC family protein [Actinoallomurus rhizosphaericola]MCO5997802.1 copper resistance protein CopC [Actinoallomurus rhizosphaericola]
MHIPRLPRLSRAGRRSLTRLAAATAAVAAGCLLTAPPASAHTTLVAAKPAKGAKVASPAQIKLTYAGPVRFPGVVLLDAKGGHHESGKAHAAGANVTERVAGVLPAGVYTVGWRVVAEDGHPVTGEYKFTVVGGGASAPAPAGSAPAVSTADSDPSAAATPSSTPAAQKTAKTSSAGWWWVGLGAVLVVAAVGGAELSRKRRASRN